MLKVFISHKHEDSVAAAELHRLLELYSTDADIFSSTRMRQGRDYRDDLVNALRDSDWFILIYKRPSLPHDWCLYEAGQFEASNRDKNNKLKEGKRLLCIHPEGIDRPSELNPYQSVSANRSDIEDFLRSYFSTVKSVILRPESEDDFDELVDKVRDVILGDTKNETLFKANSIIIKFKIDESCSDVDVPINAEVEGDKTIFYDLFNLNLSKTTWGEMKDVGRKQNDIWMREIAKAINFSRRSVRYPPIVAISRDDTKTRRYRPCLLRTERTAGGELEAEVIFSPEGTWTPDLMANQHLARILSGILISLRWHEEMLAQFSGSIGLQQNEIGPRKLKEKIRWVLFNIVKESETQGLLQPEGLLPSFDDPSDIDQLKKIYDIWENECAPAIWEGLGMSFADDVWTEFDDTPISEATIEVMEKNLAIIKEISSDFLKLSTVRLTRLIGDTY